MLGPLRRFQFTHDLAVFRHGEAEETAVAPTGHAFAFLPELTEVRLQLAVAPHMVHGVVAFVRHGIDLVQAKAPGQAAQAVKNEIFCAVAEELLNQVSRHIPRVDIVGYSGHLVHLGISDKQAVLWGSGTDLANRLHIPVINRFMQTDLQAGGVGHPILSTFWEAVTRARKKPLAVVGLSGISTLTYIGELGEQYAFDIGVGCLLVDRWLRRHADVEMDYDGTWAEKGQVDERLLAYLLKTPYLAQKPPKALDRNDFNSLLDQVEGCTPADGAATLTAFVVESILAARKFLPAPPQEWILTGGGALNPAIVLRLKKRLGGQVSTISEINMPHYNLNAAGYAFLAVRSLMGLPITFPTTTGVPEAISGGLFHGVE